MIEEKCRGTTCFKLNSIMICYRGRGLFTLHVESAAGETNPDETLKKIHSLLRGGGGKKPAISLAAIFIPRQGEPGSLWKE